MWLRCAENPRRPESSHYGIDWERNNGIGWERNSQHRRVFLEQTRVVVENLVSLVVVDFETWTSKE